jgi:ubiquitin C-terminal hydrolase
MFQVTDSFLLTKKNNRPSRPETVNNLGVLSFINCILRCNYAYKAKNIKFYVRYYF